MMSNEGSILNYKFGSYLHIDGTCSHEGLGKDGEERSFPVVGDKKRRRIKQ